MSEPTESKEWHVYILACRTGAYCVGVTNELERGWSEHQTGRGGHYTSSNPPVSILHTERFRTRAEAERRGRQFKGCTRAKKAALIAGDLDRLKRL